MNADVENPGQLPRRSRHIAAAGMFFPPGRKGRQYNNRIGFLRFLLYKGNEIAQEGEIIANQYL